MKGRIILSAAALVLVCACNLLEDNIFTGTPRYVTQGKGTGNGSEEGAGSNNTNKPDTVIYCSAVRCSDDYDWQRDTACNNADCEILLYRNGVIVASIPAGKGRNISSAPDFHHIIDGHIYTEYSGGRETVITRDGEEVLRFEGAEILYGLVCKDGKLHTLSRRRNGRGFSYRTDGQIIYSINDGILFGGFNTPSYPETGALYADGDKIVFCYREIGSGSSYHIVINGQNHKYKPSDEALVLDLKYRDGKVFCAGSSTNHIIWNESKVMFDSDFTIAGYNIRNTIASIPDSSLTVLCPGEAAFYCLGSTAAAVSQGEDGDVTVFYSDGRKHNIGGSWHFFGSDCGALVGKDVLLGISPRDSTDRPKLMLGEREYKLEDIGNGYITGVAGTISLPS